MQTKNAVENLGIKKFLSVYLFLKQFNLDFPIIFLPKLFSNLPVLL